jgi:hypothetical protein
MLFTKKSIIKRQGKEKTETLLVVAVAVAYPAAKLPAAAAVADMSLLVFAGAAPFVKPGATANAAHQGGEDG